MEKIQINQYATKEITKKIVDASIEEQAEYLKKNFQQFIKKTKQFNKKYLIMKKQIEDFERELTTLIREWHTLKADLKKNNQDYKNTDEYKKYRDIRTNIRKKYLSKQIKADIENTYKIALSFQKDINTILGQKVITVFVWKSKNDKNKNPETYLIDDMSDFIKMDVDSDGRIVMRYRNNQQALRKHIDNLEKKLKDTSDFKFELLKKTYTEKATYRYNTYKVKSGGGSYILWLNPKTGQKWHGVFVSSFGSINEAYADFILHEDYNPSNVQQDDMEQFMNKVLNVTNLSGSLEGDITIGHAEFAVKSAGATTLDIQQLYKISQHIINNKLNNYNAIQNFLKYQKNINKQKEAPINVDLNKYLQNEITEDMNEMVKHVKQVYKK